MTIRIHQPHIRWMIRQDMDSVLEINNLSFGVPATFDDFLTVLRVTSTLGKVIEIKDKIVAFMLISRYKDPYRTLIRCFAVHPEYRLHGIGRMMMNNVLNYHEFGQIVITNVPETSLSGQLFLRRMGFLCKRINPDGSYYFVRRVF